MNAPSARSVVVRSDRPSTPMPSVVKARYARAPLARAAKAPVVRIDAEIWPRTSFNVGEEVLLKRSPGVFLMGKVVGHRMGRTGETLYYVQVGVNRIMTRTKRELSA